MRKDDIWLKHVLLIHVIPFWPPEALAGLTPASNLVSGTGLGYTGCMMYADLKYLWRIARFSVVAVGVMLSFFAVIEVLRAYETLFSIHPWLGYAFAALLVGACAGSGLYMWNLLRSKPKILSPPRIRDRQNASEKELRRYCMYLTRYLYRLEHNPLLETEDRARAYREREDLERALAESGSHNTFSVAIERAEREAMEPLIRKLDVFAEREVRGCVRDVMLGVALLPYRSADLMIVIFRNSALIVRLARVYHGRPLFGDLVKIFWDTLKVVATVNFLNVSGRVLESFGSSLPFFGRMADAAAQGLGAGYFTSVAGHSAISRCRAYSGWDVNAARSSTKRNLAKFMREVTQIFTTDVVRSLAGAQLADWSADKIDAFKTKVVQVVELLIRRNAIDPAPEATPVVPIRREVRQAGRLTHVAGRAKSGVSATGRWMFRRRARRNLDSE